jgi:hypothetical protein
MGCLLEDCGSLDISSDIFPRAEGPVYTKPLDNENGSFIFPRTFPMNFREGSTLNLTWTTKFNKINLYYYQRDKVAESVQLTSK